MNIHNLRLSIIFWLVGIGIIFHFRIGFSPAWYFYATAAVLLLTHFLFANVWAAFSRLRKGELPEAEVMLNKIRKPEWLAKSPRAYYHFSKGMIELQKKETDPAESHLLRALQLGLRTPNDNAMAALNLSHIYLTKDKKSEARAMLQKARSFAPDDLMVKDYLQKTERALQ